MARTSLVERDIKAGKKLIEALDQAGFGVHAALWFYLSEPGEWQMVLASPEVDVRGPQKAYTRIQSILARASPGISLGEIKLVSPRNDLIQLLRQVVRTGSGIAGIRFTGNTVNNLFIEDAYIYRLL
jgi:hypothetical protein